MGGYGSGRPSSKQMAEHYKSLDVNRFHRGGCLRTGRSGNWVWSRDGEEVGRINYKAEEGRPVLDYKMKVYGGDWVPITQPIRITHVDCHYGNKRSYFICPGIVNGRHCGRRVGKLLLGASTSYAAIATGLPMPASRRRATTACCAVPISCAWRWAANPVLPIG